MGFFGRASGKKNTTPTAPAEAETAPEAAAPADDVRARLVAARERLEAGDVPAAVALYEELLAAAGERADVLVTISGDLGTNGCLREIIELVAPRYDAERHGPATGLNVLQAYIALRQPEPAQHILDILFALQQPRLEERLHGFSNAIAELISSQQPPIGGAPEGVSQVNLVTISKPIWYYGLETVTGLLPELLGSRRRIAFAQLALPGREDLETLAAQPEEELGRLTRAVPLWLMESFFFSAQYQPIAALGVVSRPGEAGRHALFGSEWSTDNLHQVVSAAEGSLDYVVTGALQRHTDDYELRLRLWEVRKFRERKKFTVRWAPASASEQLAALHAQLCQFMEHTAAADAFTYAPPAPRPWLDVLGASATLFLTGKGLLDRQQLPDLGPLIVTADALAADNETAALAYLSLLVRARRLGINAEVPAQMFKSPLVDQARAAL